MVFSVQGNFTNPYLCFFMKNTDLLTLISFAQNKNQKAQTQLINLFWVDVFSFVMKKVQDEHAADELTVSIFSKVLSKLDLFDPNFQFKTWILTIAQNTIIDYWRKKSRESEDSTDNFDGFKNHLALSPEELLISEEDEEQILSIIESLDANYKDIIQLRFFEEKSIKEIAEEQNITIGKTKVRIMLAKKLLAELLKNKEFED
mgnify:CR=1 FL=1